MTFLLSAQNVFDYLIEHGLCNPEDKNLDRIEPKIAKNFNLLVSLLDEQKLLVKQEPYRDGKTPGDFKREWSIQQFVRQFPEVSYLQVWLPEILNYDAETSILVVKYLDEYENLAEFYNQEHRFKPAIASCIGSIIAKFHRSTINRSDFRYFFTQINDNKQQKPTLKLDLGLDRIEPEIFGQVPSDG